MARRKPAQQKHDESGLDEFHPDTTHNPGPVGDVPALPQTRPGDRRKAHLGNPIPDRRQKGRGDRG